MEIDAEKWIEKIFDEWGTKILGYLRTLLKDEHCAEDVMQNIFIRLFRLANSNYEIREIRTFLFTLARNEALREIQRIRKEKHKPLEENAPIFDLKSAGCLDPTEKMLLQESFRILPAEQREVVYLKIYGGLTLEEISRCLEIPVNTAGSRYRYGMEKMRDFIGDRI